MSTAVTTEIEDMKQLLITLAEKHDFDFQNPHVITVSQKLDLLIVEAMKPQQSP
ncbi:aspartyl-phosphate phosphatase Spo0E family protein [Aneurinibacillus aneurinilyticus]|uniref:Aspartyl-phosphate phosphatase Spo0E family protein n=2 Tax=Aneurinibacillus aneurinilyticus TaxID=1391 RepID=A0A848CP91_ANEAE|nr:aspartyl-phosphate phosphatase Spo0E family protein [Aneurinibacillus aneurinilyticus]ERI05551.1 Spo0E like sporulation regulatory protein [Aneurinibacillus aneurinilyticus ATCC 12856]MCI1693681.1 aspartyl-phosphate phosphatase Spo0E family protein [Aneurinibacillus aneurinilyticus]MED0671028.1 aspartyl-phosphate phosphatase Spo0E family protein [Aneurinibacillus aneurinilyticus]MED0704780.1 aspartyl-phosphate phosphatase Spo0E family protein [Aneurinibacillus aneurinilyticus]MED0722617.1 a